MDVEIRVAREDEFEPFGRTVAAAFGDELPREFLERIRRVVDLDRCLVALDGDELVGTAEALRLTLTVPGGQVRAGGVTSVGVLPTHRRRGIQTRLMRRQLDDLRGWGEAVAVLWASEASIYHRYGYGLATRNGRLDAERGRFAFQLPSAPAGRMRLLAHEQALELLPGIYDRVRAVTPGFYERSRDWWEALTLADTDHERRGAGPLFRGVLELDGRPEAYALYRVRKGRGLGVATSTLVVQEAIATSPLATRELWRFLFGVDLIERVEAKRIQADHPLFLLAAEPPRLNLSLGDGLWLRIVDIPGALSARSYAGEGSLVIEVSDALCPWNEGRWRLDAAPSAARVERTGEPAGLRVTAADLGAAYLGGFAFADLVRAGRVEELTGGAVARADALFRTDGAPWCPELF